MYGFRVIGPTLIGASQLPPKIFLPLNIPRRICLGVDFYHYWLRWWSGDCAVVAQSRPAFEALGLVDSGRGSGGGRALVAETTRGRKSRIIRRKTIALDKALSAASDIRSTMPDTTLIASFHTGQNITQ